MNAESLSNAIIQLILRAETRLPNDIIFALEDAAAREEGEMGKSQLSAILKNIELAGEKNLPLCQDTGMQTFYVKAGANFPFLPLIEKAIISGVMGATTQIPLRPNAVDPLTNSNSGDNTGVGVPIIHWELRDGDSCEITAMPKGGGSENCSTLKMFNPGDGLDTVKRFIADWVVRAGGKPCPPTIVGVGIGGGADYSLELAKRSLLRPVGQKNIDPTIAKMEKELLKTINGSGIGPMGLGGKTTALAVNMEIAARHPASLPVAIVIQCWAARRARMIIKSDGTVIQEG